MKIGTIMKNRFASNVNPRKYFVYIGVDGKYVTGIYLDDDNKLGGVRYCKDDLRNGEMLEVVGYTEAFEIMRSDLKSFVKTMKPFSIEEVRETWKE